MKNAYFFLAVLLTAAGLLLVGRSLWTKHQHAREAQALMQQLSDLKARVDLPPTSNTPLNQSPADRKELFAARYAYNELDLRKPLTEATFQQLSKLGQGLASQNEIVRETTGDFIRHVLTDYVRGTPRENWHREKALDEFFRLYKQAKSQSLTQFLNVFPRGPEAEYLRTI